MRDQRVVETAADDFQRATQRREIADVPVDDNQSLEAGVINHSTICTDGIDQRLRLEGDRARPAARVPERTAVAQRG